jgi:hypothetical protein
MVDIETLADTNNAVIVTIGAVKFDIETGETGKQFYKNIDIDSCLDAGFEVTGGTIRWWMTNSEEARKEMAANGVHILDALYDFGQFLKDEDYHIWANGLRFDTAILENAYRRLKLPVPWNHRNEMDVRTLVAFAPEIKKEIVKNRINVRHNAIDDCLTQIEYCTKTYNKLKIV